MLDVGDVMTRIVIDISSLKVCCIEQPSPASKVKALIPMYEPLEVVNCKSGKRIKF